MQRMIKWIAPVVALGLLVGVTATKAVAEDAKGTVSGTVTGADGKAAAGVPVKLNKARAKGEKPAAGEKPVAVATATTDEKGKFEMKDVPVGDYVAMAGGKKAGGAGREKVSVTAGGTAEVTITLKAADPAASGEKKGKKNEAKKEESK